MYYDILPTKETETTKKFSNLLPKSSIYSGKSRVWTKLYLIFLPMPLPLPDAFFLLYNLADTIALVLPTNLPSIQSLPCYLPHPQNWPTYLSQVGPWEQGTYFIHLLFHTEPSSMHVHWRCLENLHWVWFCYVFHLKIFSASQTYGIKSDFFYFSFSFYSYIF